MSDEAIEEWDATGTIDEDKPEPDPRETLEEKYPDVDIPHLSAVVQLLYLEGKEIRDIEYIEATPYVIVNLKGEEYLILNEDEADEKTEEEIAKMLDEDVRSLSGEWRNFINNSDDFDNLLAEKVTEYIDAIREEPAPAGDGTTELDQQMMEAGVTTEPEFEIYLVNKWSPSGDSAEWYLDEYGDQAFNEIADIDTVGLAQHILVAEGKGAVLSEDGEELKLGHGYFAYKQ